MGLAVRCSCNPDRLLEVDDVRAALATRRRRLQAAVLAALVGMAITTGTAPSVAADPCVAPPNEIVAENCLPGTPPTIWDVRGGGSSSIQGFATDISVNRSQRVDFKIDTTAPSYRMDIYRMGYYGGDGARKVAAFRPSAGLPRANRRARRRRHGTCRVRELELSASWDVPGRGLGIYFAQLVDSDRRREPRLLRRPRRRRRARTCCSRPRTRPGRPTTITAATLYTGAPPAGAFKV